MTIQASQVITEEGAEIHRELVAMRISSQKKLPDRLTRAKREGDLPYDADADSLARFLVAIYQVRIVQSVNGARRKDLLDLVETSLVGWPMVRESGTRDFGACRTKKVAGSSDTLR